MLYLRLEEIQ